MLRLVAWAGVLGWLIGFVVFVVRMPGPVGAAGQHLGGDSLNFYTAGRMVLDGDGPDLYDLRSQLTVQQGVVGSPNWSGLAAYVNPPALALACAPLAVLPYKVAYVCSAVLLATALFLGLRLLRPHVPALAAHWDVVVLLAMVFYPLARTITGGQNTALTFLLMAGAYGALRRGHSVRAGLWLGALFYKPQLALVLCLMLALRREYRAVAIAAAGAAVHYAIGVLVSGPAWPLELSNCLRAYWPLEFKHNGAHLVSWMGFCEYALPAALYKSAGLGLTALTLVALALLWRRGTPRGEWFPLQWGAAVCATVLISPHTQWYDAGLALLAVLLVLDYCGQQQITVSWRIQAALLAGYLAYPVYLAAPLLGFQPLSFLPMLVLLWCVRLATCSVTLQPALTA